MCVSLTEQVRTIANVTTAVAKGNLTQKIEIEVEGEMLTLKTTVNAMVDQLSASACKEPGLIWQPTSMYVHRPLQCHCLLC